MLDAASKNDDRFERFVWKRQLDFLPCGETRILECLWVTMTLLKESEPEPPCFYCNKETLNG